MTWRWCKIYRTRQIRSKQRQFYSTRYHIIWCDLQHTPEPSQWVLGTQMFNVPFGPAEATTPVTWPPTMHHRCRDLSRDVLLPLCIFAAQSFHAITQNRRTVPLGRPWGGTAEAAYCIDSPLSYDVEDADLLASLPIHNILAIRPAPLCVFPPRLWAATFSPPRSASAPTFALDTTELGVPFFSKQTICMTFIQCWTNVEDVEPNMWNSKIHRLHLTLFTNWESA